MGRKGCRVDQWATGRPLARLVVSVFCGIFKITLIGLLLGKLLVGCRLIVNVCESICILGGVWMRRLCVVFNMDGHR